MIDKSSIPPALARAIVDISVDTGLDNPTFTIDEVVSATGKPLMFSKAVVTAFCSNGYVASTYRFRSVPGLQPLNLFQREIYIVRELGKLQQVANSEIEVEYDEPEPRCLDSAEPVLDF